MLKNLNDPKDVQQVLLSILSTSGTLAGISMTLVGIVNLRAIGTKTETMADDCFLFASVGFLLVCFLVFFALRQLDSKNLRYWTNTIDAVFLLSMSMLVFSGFLVVYEVSLHDIRRSGAVARVASTLAASATESG